MNAGALVPWRLGTRRSEAPCRTALSLDTQDHRPNEVPTLSVAVIDGPYDAAALHGILARTPVSLGNGSCGVSPDIACHHGTFIVGMLGARRNAPIPGLCPDCILLHVPLFIDESGPWANVAELANAITIAVRAGAKLINLSVAIMGDDAHFDTDLAKALDLAEASGAVVMVAAGNQGRRALGQLLSHPVTIPVVAVDAAHRLLPDCNFGPSISRRGIAALGYRVRGYAPGGGTTVMSGTSVATAAATGTLAQLWSACPDAKGAEIRSAVARLSPRNGIILPMLDRDTFLAEIRETHDAKIAAASLAAGGSTSYACLQGKMTMNDGNGQPMPPNYGGDYSTASFGHAVIPAHASGGCACAAPGGVCTCAEPGSAPPRFIYVLGSVDIRFPDQSISEELQDVARKKKIIQGADEPLRIWYSRVLVEPEARYVARKVCWILKVEGVPAYYLALRDLYDLPDLISCLGHPENDLDLFVGLSSLIPVETCPEITAPTLIVDQLCSFEQNELISWFNPSSKTPRKPSSGKKTSDQNEYDPNELFKKLVQSADNFGNTDEQRALNFLAVRYKPLYELFAKMVTAKNGWALDSVRVAASRLQREKRIVDPVFSFQQMETGVVKKYFVRVDVSHLFPMIVNHITEYLDR